MLLQPTDKRIYFSEFDVLNSVKTQLSVAYARRAGKADSEVEKQWWWAQSKALEAFYHQADDTNRQDLIDRTRALKKTLDVLGGVTGNGQF